MKPLVMEFLERSNAENSGQNSEMGSWEPLDEIPAAGHMTLRTDRAVKDIIGDVIALLHRRLAPLA